MGDESVALNQAKPKRSVVEVCGYSSPRRSKERRPLLVADKFLMEFRAGHITNGNFVDAPGGELIHARATDSDIVEHISTADEPAKGMVHQRRPLRAHAQAPIVFITADELKTKLASNEPVTIIDVRSSEGYASSATTIKGALHFKLRKLKSRLAFAPLKDLPRDREIVTYCACPKDQSSISAAQTLQSGGFKRVRVLQGGWHEWVRANGPGQPK